jgi:hypothetical protein
MITIFERIDNQIRKLENELLELKIAKQVIAQFMEADKTPAIPEPKKEPMFTVKKTAPAKQHTSMEARMRYEVTSVLEEADTPLKTGEIIDRISKHPTNQERKSIWNVMTKFKKVGKVDHDDFGMYWLKGKTFVPKPYLKARMDEETTA